VIAHNVTKHKEKLDRCWKWILFTHSTSIVF